MKSSRHSLLALPETAEILGRRRRYEAVPTGSGQVAGLHGEPTGVHGSELMRPASLRLWFSPATLNSLGTGRELLNTFVPKVP